MLHSSKDFNKAVCLISSQEEAIKLLLEALELVKFLEARNGFQAVRIKKLEEQVQRQVKMLEALD